MSHSFVKVILKLAVNESFVAEYTAEIKNIITTLPLKSMISPVKGQTKG